ncbi:MAG: hypothetical protein QNJ81_07970 [Acidimicrobiia bacterium]|nr:hypothetical protein [Acidimicrobiia bacterium]
MKRDLRERLANLRIETDEVVAQQHLTAIGAELRDPGPIARRTTRRTRRLTLVAAAVLVLIPATALAAENAVPGDLLYPIKLVAEDVLGIVDPHIEAKHRIEELELVVDRDAPAAEIADRLLDAEQSVRDYAVPPDLLRRLELVRDRITDQAGATGGGDGSERRQDENQHRDAPEEPVTDTTVRTPTSEGPRNDQAPHDGTTTTTKAPRRRGDTTTTAPPRGDDRPRDDRRG